MKVLLMVTLVALSLTAREPDRRPPGSSDQNRPGVDHNRPNDRPGGDNRHDRPDFDRRPGPDYGHRPGPMPGPIYRPTPVPPPVYRPVPVPPPIYRPIPVPPPSYRQCTVELRRNMGNGELLQVFSGYSCDSAMRDCQWDLERRQSMGTNPRASCRFSNNVGGGYDNYITRVCTYTLYENGSYNYGGRYVVDTFTEVESGFSDSFTLDRACEKAERECRMVQRYGQFCERTSAY